MLKYGHDLKTHWILVIVVNSLLVDALRCKISESSRERQGQISTVQGTTHGGGCRMKGNDGLNDK